MTAAATAVTASQVNDPPKVNERTGINIDAGQQFKLPEYLKHDAPGVIRRLTSHIEDQIFLKIVEPLHVYRHLQPQMSMYQFARLHIKLRERYEQATKKYANGFKCVGIDSYIITQLQRICAESNIISSRGILWDIHVGRGPILKAHYGPISEVCFGMLRFMKSDLAAAKKIDNSFEADLALECIRYWKLSFKRIVIEGGPGLPANRTTNPLYDLHLRRTAASAFLIFQYLDKLPERSSLTDFFTSRRALRRVRNHWLSLLYISRPEWYALEDTTLATDARFLQKGRNITSGFERPVYSFARTAMFDLRTDNEDLLDLLLAAAKRIDVTAIALLGDDDISSRRALTLPWRRSGTTLVAVLSGMWNTYATAVRISVLHAAQLLELAEYLLYIEDILTMLANGAYDHAENGPYRNLQHLLSELHTGRYDKLKKAVEETTQKSLALLEVWAVFPLQVVSDEDEDLEKYMEDTQEIEQGETQPRIQYRTEPNLLQAYRSPTPDYDDNSPLRFSPKQEENNVWTSPPTPPLPRSEPDSAEGLDEEVGELEIFEGDRDVEMCEGEGYGENWSDEGVCSDAEHDYFGEEEEEEERDEDEDEDEDDMDREQAAIYARDIVDLGLDVYGDYDEDEAMYGDEDEAIALSYQQESSDNDDEEEEEEENDDGFVYGEANTSIDPAIIYRNSVNDENDYRDADNYINVLRSAGKRANVEVHDNNKTGAAAADTTQS